MKVALITGASGDIGKEIVKVFIDNGYFVVGQYNSDVLSIENLKKDLSNNGQGDYFFGIKCDFTSLKSVEEFFSSVEKSFKHIDVLVNNAGVDLIKLSTETTVKEFDKIFDVNMKATFLTCNFALKSMIERKEGAIINISSVWGINGASMESVYSASKFAVVGYTKSLAKEVAPSNVRVNCICPGVIDTKMNDCFNSEEKKDLISSIPIGRLGTAKEVAESVYFLSSDKAKYVTGAVLSVDGGYSL